MSSWYNCPGCPHSTMSPWYNCPGCPHSTMSPWYNCPGCPHSTMSPWYKYPGCPHSTLSPYLSRLAECKKPSSIPLHNVSMAPIQNNDANWCYEPQDTKNVLPNSSPLRYLRIRSRDVWSTSSTDLFSNTPANLDSCRTVTCWHICLTCNRQHKIYTDSSTILIPVTITFLHHTQTVVLVWRWQWRKHVHPTCTHTHIVMHTHIHTSYHSHN